VKNSFKRNTRRNSDDKPRSFPKESFGKSSPVRRKTNDRYSSPDKDTDNKQDSGYKKDYSYSKDTRYKKDSGYRKDNRFSKNTGYKKDFSSGKDSGYHKDSDSRTNSGFKKDSGYNKDSSFRKESGYKKDFSPGKETRYHKDFDSGEDSSFKKDTSYNKDSNFQKESGYKKDSGYSKDSTFRKNSGYKKDTGYNKDNSYRKDPGYKQDFRYKKDGDYKKDNIRKSSTDSGNEDAPIRLNKYIATAGICSRREADNLIESGLIKINGTVVTQLGTKVNRNDLVEFKGKRLSGEKLVYILLNKPKDYITTVDDPEGRRTVMDLVKHACPERVFPVGRLDRNTTGVLLFTNDGDLTKKLTHPKYAINKIYEVVLDKALSANDMEHIKEGVELEDGLIKVDDVAFASINKKEIGVELHSGRNRIVRRIFEKFNYKIVKLDRVSFAGLTKKDTPRGHWRFLTPKEIGYLKML